MWNANSQLWDHTASQTRFLILVSNPNPTKENEGFPLEVSLGGGVTPAESVRCGGLSRIRMQAPQRTVLKGQHFYNCSEDKH